MDRSPPPAFDCTLISEVDGESRRTEPAAGSAGEVLPTDTLAVRLVFFALAFAIYFADDWILDVAGSVRRWAELPRTEWNWFGKFASIIFSCLLLALWPWLRRNVGLRVQQADGSARLSWRCFASYWVVAIAIGFLAPRIAFSAETLWFQLLMPGIDEELLMRGILLAILERACRQSPMSNRLRFGYAGVMTCLMFGVPHGLSTVDGHYEFSWIAFLATTMWAIPATLVRTRSGSLVWPIIYHGIWNATIFAVAMR